MKNKFIYFKSIKHHAKRPNGAKSDNPAYKIAHEVMFFAVKEYLFHIF
jgi:hypothetical protein